MVGQDNGRFFDRFKVQRDLDNRSRLCDDVTDDESDRAETARRTESREFFLRSHVTRWINNREIQQCLDAALLKTTPID